MRNKLKRSQSKGQAKITEVIKVLLSESSCSDGKTSAEGDSAPPPAAAPGVTGRKVHPPRDEGKTCCAKDAKIAPIFLCTPRQRENKGSSDGKLQKPEPPPQYRLSPPAAAHLTEKQEVILSNRGGQLPPSSVRSCLEEIEASNPAFPVRTVFSALQKKAGESLQESGPTGNSPDPSSPLNHFKEKRRPGDESEERASKRLRCGLPAEGALGVDQCHLLVPESVVPPAKEQIRSSKLSRSRRLRQRSLTGPATSCEPNSARTNDTDSDGRSPMTHDTVRRESSFEDVLWTDKYSPQHSSEVIGNSVSVNKLHGWLKKWKLQADCEERRRMEERRDEDNSHHSWDAGDFQGEAGAEDAREGPLCNTVLITGPPGVGKTASVYACAQELGFKVFEVNCSSQRSGRHVLSQLQEATQSHLVETSGKDPLKPAYFNNYNTSSCSPKSETGPGKTVPPKTVITTSKKRAAQSLGRARRKGKANPATVTLASYFKTKAKADLLHFGGLSPSVKPESKKVGNPSPGCDQTGPQSKKTTTSLILFEEVDVIFDDDVGFLAAIRTFMTTTKRPVILTTNDPLFRERFSCSVEEIVFKTPSAVNVCSYLQLVCLAEHVRLELEDVRSLLTLTCGDVRRCMLQLQLWAHGSGGRASQSGGLHRGPTHVQYSNASEVGGSLDSSLPPCDTACTAAMLGLHPVTQNHLLNLLKCQHWSETDMNKLPRFLAESWRAGVPLLYTNLELILPFAARGASVRHPGKVTCPGLQKDVTLSDAEPRGEQLNNQGVSPKASVTNSKSVRNISRLSRRKYTPAVLDTSSSTLTHKPQKTSSSLNGFCSRLHCSSDNTEQTAAKAATDCLDALADFFDLMSYIDATLPPAAPLVSGSCTPEAFVWTGAEIKDGLLDEMSEEEEEEGRSWSQERLPDIQAAAEGLGCHRCWWRVSEAWSGAQKYRRQLEGTKWERLVETLGFPASSKRQSLRFSFQPACPPSVSRRRYELSRTVLSSKSLSLLGNRQAVSVDYAPVLRSICRFQRAQQQKEEPARCVNYLSSIHMDLSKSTIQRLAEDFS